jgi:hypothetical protein
MLSMFTLVGAVVRQLVDLVFVAAHNCLILHDFASAQADPHASPFHIKNVNEPHERVGKENELRSGDLVRQN